MNVFEYESNMDKVLPGSGKFWVTTLALLYVASVLQLLYGNFMLGVANLALSVVFTSQAYEKFWKEREEE